jgi:gluconolactonase
MNAFHDTRLDTLLRGLEVETLVVTGAWTNMSVEHTARHAADAGYRVAVASDGTATMSEEWQHAALGYALTQVATIATCAELEELLRSD